MGDRLFVPAVLSIFVATEEVSVNFAQVEGFLELILLMVLDRAYFTLWSLDVSSSTRIIMDPVQITHTARCLLDIGVILRLGGERVLKKIQTKLNNHAR